MHKRTSRTSYSHSVSPRSVFVPRHAAVLPVVLSSDRAEGPASPCRYSLGPSDRVGALVRRRQACLAPVPGVSMHRRVCITTAGQGDRKSIPGR